MAVYSEEKYYYIQWLELFIWMCLTLTYKSPDEPEILID